MVKKVTCIVILFFVICGNVFSQNGRELSQDERQVFEQKIAEQSQKIKTLQCAFVQEKISSLVSEKFVTKGIMLYQVPSMLRWEYVEPTPSTLILNGNNAALLDKNGQRMGNERMLQQLGGIIVAMVNGSGITQNRLFSSAFYEPDHAQILVVLTPTQRRLKDFFDRIELKVDQKTMLASDIILHEKTGDKTTISLSNTILNAEISQSNFEIK